MSPPASPGGRSDSDPGAPYVGPRPYARSEGEIFFGRDREAAAVASLWLASRVVVLHGSGGVGKTSLLCAGVLPRIARRRPDVDVLPVGKVVYQSARPMAAGQSPRNSAYPLISSWAPVNSPPHEDTSIADFLLGRPSRVNKYGDLIPVLAAIDHFEELYTAYPLRTSERAEIIAQLAAALDRVPALRLLLVLRDDHLADFAADEPQLAPYPATHVRLLPLGPEFARAAIAEPARLRGHPLDSAMVQQLVDDLRSVRFLDALGGAEIIRNSYVEPIPLQIVCQRIWRRLFTGQGAEPLADFDVNSALMEFYTDAVRNVADAHSFDEARLFSWMVSTFVTERGTRASTYRGVAMTDDMPNEIVDALAGRSVLTSEDRMLGTWYQLSQGRLVEVVRQVGTLAAAPTQTTDAGNASPAEPQPQDYRVAAQEALGKGDFSMAAQLAQEAAQRFQTSGEQWKWGDTLALLGAVARAAGDVRESTEHYLNAVTVFSVIDDLRSVLRLYLVLAEMHFLAYDYTNAVVFSRQGLEYVPGSVEARTALAYSLWYEGHPADARAEFNQALGADAANSLALSGRGQVDVELAARAEHGNFDPALADLGRALGLGLPSPVPEADAHSARAVALAHQGLGQEAEAALHTALAMVPGRSLTLLRAALVRGWGDDHAGARNLLDEAANALPPLSPWHAGLARQARTRWSG